MTSLLNAIEDNDIDAVSLLIKKGESVNANDPSFAAPLFLAAEMGRVEIMRMLLDRGAVIDDGFRTEQTACYAAIASGSFDALKLLVERGAKLDGFHLKAAAEFAMDDRTILFLLDAGAPLNRLASEDVMGLIANPSSIAVLKRLLAHNIDVYALRDKFNRTLCHYVVDRAEPDEDIDELIRALADAGMNIDAVDEYNTSPFHYGAQKSSARILVELGADIDRETDFGIVALHAVCLEFYAARSRVELLLALGANVHSVDDSGDTASHKACREPSNLSACLAAGGDLDHRDKNGDTVRTIASRNHFQLPTSDEIDDARRRIAKIRLEFVRQRAFQICIGLQPLNLNALELCEILRHSFGALGSLIAFHQWWAIATTVKHFHQRKFD